MAEKNTLSISGSVDDFGLRGNFPDRNISFKKDNSMPSVVATMLRIHCTLGLCSMILTGCATSPPIDEVEKTERSDIPSGTPARPSGSGDIFVGSDRRDAKTSVAIGGVEYYSTISALRGSLPTDEYMLGLGITRAAGCGRVSEEQHNVSVGGYIYAASKESDNDLHLIVGDRNCATGDCLINVEVSGLPQEPGAPDFQTLSTVRKKLLTYLGRQQPRRGYEKFAPPIAVTLTGSIFFDVDHRAGAVGPSGFRPDTAWEIHPLTDISFEP